MEAKAWNEELTEGVGQAKDYATKLQLRYTFATNGRGIYAIDMETGHESEVSAYPSPDELWNKTFSTANVWRDRFSAVPFEDRGDTFRDVIIMIWSVPETRSKLLDSLADAGFGAAQRGEMQRAIDAENSDLFDVLAYVAWESPPLTQTDRAEAARVQIHSTFNEKQQAFLDFVLAHYVSEGVSELDQKKLSPLLRLRYNDSIPDAIADLGRPDEIGRVFAGFQKFLYQGGA